MAGVGPNSPSVTTSRSASRQRDLLIEHLHTLQDTLGHLPASHLAALAHEMRLSQAEVFEVASFYHHFDIVKEGQPAPAALTVRVCDGLSCERAGAQDLLARLPGLLGREVRVIPAPCVGRCEQAPVVVVLQATGGDPGVAGSIVASFSGDGRSLVARILAFSRGGLRAHVPLVLAPVIDVALDLLAGSLRPDVQLLRELNAPDAVVMGDATQLFESVSNLCANALHAMPEGGTLRVRLDTLETAAPRPLSHGTLPPGRHVCVAISDSGVGMDRDVMEHLFEPFFSSESRSSGLGLYICRELCERYGAQIAYQRSRLDQKEGNEF